MEALTAVAVAALTIYDMVKAVDKEMVIGDICLVEKTGGRSGHYRAHPRPPVHDRQHDSPLLPPRADPRRADRRWARWRSTCTCRRCRRSRASSAPTPPRCRSASPPTSSGSPSVRRSTGRSRTARPQAGALLRPGVFIVSSIGCALAESVDALVAFRFLQALGGCAPIVIPRAVVRDYFDQRGSVRMLSMLMLVMGLAPILAPLIGGQLLVNFGWRSVFWVLAGYAAVWLIVVGRVSAREPAVAGVAVSRLVPCSPFTARLVRDRALHRLRLVGRADLCRTAGLHLGVAVRLHRTVSRAARTLRVVLRHERASGSSRRRRSIAGWRRGSTRGASSASCCPWR